MMKTSKKRDVRASMRTHCPICNKNAMPDCGRIKAAAYLFPSPPTLKKKVAYQPWKFMETLFYRRYGHAEKRASQRQKRLTIRAESEGSLLCR